MTKTIYILGKVMFRNAHLVLGLFSLFCLLGGNEIGAGILIFTMIFVDCIQIEIEQFEKNQKFKLRIKSIIFIATYLGVAVILFALSYTFYPYEIRINMLITGSVILMVTIFALKYYRVKNSVYIS